MKARWTCTCPDYATRGVECKHIHAAKFTEAAHKNLQTLLPGQMPKRPRAHRAPLFAAGAQDESDVEAVSCKFCGSGEVVRNGFKNGKQERCCSATCGRKFIPDDGFARLKGDAKSVCLALDLYFKGVSLRQIADTLGQFFGLRLSHVTVYRWLCRYVDSSTTTPPRWNRGCATSGTRTRSSRSSPARWNTCVEYLWHVMDADTRYLPVSCVTKARTDANAKRVFGEARRLAGKTPDEIVTDGLPAYVQGVNSKLRGAKHTREIHISKPERYPHNNRVERINGTVRGRQKVTRGLKRPNGPVTQGYHVYYNHIRPHAALAGRTPGEAAGVPLQQASGEPKWAALIRDASRRNGTDK